MTNITAAFFSWNFCFCFCLDSAMLSLFKSQEIFHHVYLFLEEVKDGPLADDLAPMLTKLSQIKEGPTQLDWNTKSTYNLVAFSDAF